MRGASILLSLASPLLLAGAGCAPEGAPDAGVVEDAGPPEVPGGGTSGGEIDGRLRVFVVEAVGGAPVANASVRVGEGDDEVASEVTGGDGVAVFTGLSGPQTVTVHGEGLVNATWAGVAVENVTIPVARDGGRPPMGSISGEVADFHANFQPFGEHYTLVHIRTTSDANLSRAEAALRIDGDPSCAHNGENEPGCDFTIEVPAGPVSLLATILEVDGQGTPFVLDDDELVGVMGYAYALDVDVPEGEVVSVGALTQMEEGQLEDLAYPFPAAAPASLSRVLGFAFLDLGERGLLPVFVPFTPEDATHPVPALAGPFADARYVLYGRAVAETGRRASVGLAHDVTALAGAPSLPAWMDPPGDLDADDRALSWSGVEGAELYRLELSERGAVPLWDIYVLDARTELTLPLLLPRLPNGTMHLRVRALGGGVDPRRLVLDELAQTLERTSEDTRVYSR